MALSARREAVGIYVLLNGALSARERFYVRLGGNEWCP